MKSDKNTNKNQQEPEEKYDIKREIAEWVVVVVFALALAVIINTFLLINAAVPSGSMENTVMTGDRLIGNRLAYINDDPERGDIVIFRYPDDEEQLFIKRVIGLPGDTVSIIDGKVYINGAEEPLEEPYLAQEMIGTFGPYEVPEGAYFMMGDNRNYSADSRFWVNTFVYKDKILGKAVFRYFPHPGKIKNANPVY